MFFDAVFWVLFILFFHNVQASYILSKDFFIGYKAAEFSIYQSNKPLIQYRIESDFALGQKIKLVKQSTKNMIAQLRAEWTTKPHPNIFSIFNSSTEQWNNGTIKRLSNKKPTKYSIRWNANTIWMNNQMNGSTIFQDEDENILLASFQAIRASFAESKRYELQIFSNTVPEAVFFLALAVEDAFQHRKGRG